MAEDLDDLLSVHHLLNKALFLADLLLLTDEMLCGKAAELSCHDDHCRCAEGYDQRHPETEIEHYPQQRRHDKGGYHYLRNAFRNKLAHRVDVVRVAAHYVPVAVGVKERQRQRFHFFKHLAAHFFERSLGYHGHELMIDET